MSAEGLTEFTLENIKTPDGIGQLNRIMRTIYDNISGDTENVRIFNGYGSPEAVVAAGIGSLYLRVDGGSGTSFYKKTSGTGNTGWEADSSLTLPLSVANGGSGQDASAGAQGSLFYFSATGVLSILGPGTSGQFLKTLGAAANPLWATVAGSVSNVLFQYSGQVDQQGASAGEVIGTTLVPNAATGNYRFLQINPAGTYTLVWSSKFIKVSGISTVTVYARIWQRRAVGSICNIKVDIGGANGNVSGTADQQTPEWKSFTIDVSGLSNGTAYDVTALLKEPNSNSEILYCSDIIGFGS